MPRSYVRRWYRLDLYAALDRLQALFARRRVRPSELGKPIFAKPDLTPLDFRNPPSEMLDSVALPLSVTAANLAAGVYFAAAETEAQKQAEEQTSAWVAAQVGGADRTPPRLGSGGVSVPTRDAATTERTADRGESSSGSRAVFGLDDGGSESVGGLNEWSFGGTFSASALVGWPGKGGASGGGGGSLAFPGGAGTGIAGSSGFGTGGGTEFVANGGRAHAPVGGSATAQIPAATGTPTPPSGSGRTGSEAQSPEPSGVNSSLGNAGSGVLVAVSHAAFGQVIYVDSSIDYHGAHVDLTVTAMPDGNYRWEYLVTNDSFWGGASIGYFEIDFSGLDAVGLSDVANDVDWANVADGTYFSVAWSMIPGFPSQFIAPGGGTGEFAFTTSPRAVIPAHIQLDSSEGFTFVGPGDEVQPPIITGMTTDTGASSSDQVTSDTTPTLSGTAPASSTVTVYRQGPGDPAPVSLGTTTASGGGTWSFSHPGSPLADATYAYTATVTESSTTSLPSVPFTVVVDTTLPDVSLMVDTGTPSPNETYDLQPPVVLTATDLVGFANPTTATLDVDLDNSGTFDEEEGEVGYATATFVNGMAVFSDYPAFIPGDTVQLRGYVSDLAGNEGTSPLATLEILTTTGPWDPVDQTPRTRSGHGLLFDGDVTTSHRLDLDVSAVACDCQDPYLVYHSQEAAPAPIVQAVVTSDNALGLPDHVYGTLTWDGGTVGGIDYDLSQLSPGSDWLFSYAAPSSPATGRHTYTLSLFVDYPDTINDHSISVAGDTFVVNRSASPYGAGWSFSNTDTLYPISASGSYPAGILRASGKGAWAFYAETGGGQYTEPPGDAGTMVSSGGGGWTYTSPSGRASQFDTSGRMTSWTHLGSGETLTYTYDASGGVATMKGPDGGIATFAYSSGKLTTITSPGNRVTALAYTGTDLTQITDPGASGTHTFAYSAHRLTSETQGSARASYAYDAAGLVSSVTSGAAAAITPGATSGLGAGATAGPGGSLPATFTDALGNAWRTWLDAFGQPVKTQDPVGAVRTFERDDNGFVTKSTDALNRTTSYTVDAAGRVLTETRPDGSNASWVYGGAYGSVTKYTDYNGGVYTYTNDANGNRLTETDPLNHTTTYTYSNGLLQTVKDATGNVTTYLYDAARRPTGALLGNAVTGTTGYDAAGNPNTYTDPRGNVTTTTYDGAGRVVGTLNPLLERTTNVYDTGGFLLSTSDGLGRITSYAYDTAGRMVETIEAYGTGLQRRTTLVYDAAGQMIAMIDPLGRRTTSVYDAAGRVVVTVDALGNRTTSVYDLEGQLTATVDPLGRTTQYHYDLLGRMDAVTDPLGETTSTTYDANSNVVESIDPLGHRSTSVYDAADRLRASVDPLGNRTTYAYDNANRLIETTDPRSNTTTTVYDARNRIWYTIDPFNKRTTFGYDAADNQITRTDPLNHKSTTVYDKLNRVEATVDGVGNPSTVVYDAAGMVLATVDPRGNRTTTTYDVLGRAVETIDARNNRWTTVYDAADQVVASVDPLGNRTSYGYDPLGRLLETQDAGNFRTTNAYDAAGQLTATRNALNERTTYGYDAAGRLVTTTDALNHTWTTAYDELGRVIESTDPNGHTTTTVYDFASRVLATIDPRGERTTYGYDKASNLESVTDALHHTTTTVYDELNRVQAIVDAKNQRTTTTYDAAGRVKTVVDPLNHTTTYDYDNADRLIRTIDAAGNVWTTQYDAASNVLFTTDPRNNTTSYQYDQLNRVEAVVDPLLKRTTTTYDAAGNVKTTIDQRHNTTTYDYDARNLPVRTTDAAGNVWTTQYDPLGRVSRTIDPKNHGTTTTYDPAGRVIETMDALGNRTTTVYDPVGNVRATVDALNHRTTMGYDAADRPITTTDAAENVWTTSYDDVGNVLSRTDPRGNTTSYEYDELNRVRAVVDALSKRTTTTYDAAGNVKTVTDPLLHTITYDYDARNLRTKTTDALGEVWTTNYDAVGNVQSSIDARGKSTSYEYDELNRVKAVVDPLGKRTTTTYDEAGNVKTVTNPRGFTTTTNYDALNRPVETIDALGNIWTTQYDAVGNVEARIDPLGERTTMVYDELNRLTTTIDPMLHVTTTTYDAVGNVKTTADPLDQVTSYTYDELNRLKSTTDPRGFATTYNYDAAGNRESLRDASGNVTTWAYDQLNRVVTETNPLGANATFAYDDAGRKSSETDRLGRRKDYAYDAANRLLTEKWYAAGGAFVQTQTFTYDEAGNLLTAQDPDGTYTLTYDDAGRVETVQEPFSLVLTFTYDEAGNRTRVADSRAMGVTTTIYDALNREESVRSNSNGGVASRFDTDYNARGEITTRRRYSDLSGTTLVSRTTYAYDDAGRMTGIRHYNSGGGVLVSYAYDYDAAGRVTARTTASGLETYGYDAADQLTAEGGSTTFGYDATGNRTNSGYATTTGNRTTSDGTWTYTYDAAGNVTKKSKGASSDTWVYSYDHNNQLLTGAFSATDGGAATKRVTYAYDAYGNRVVRQAWVSGSGTTTTRYGVDGWDPGKAGAEGTANFDTWVQLDGANALVARYQHGAGLDEVVSRQGAGGGFAWYLGDNVGSLRRAVNNAGTLVASANFSAYGQFLAGTLLGEYGYAGREWDDVLETWYMRARVYDAELGRFLSEDPKGFAAGDSNLYKYVGNSPTNATDPSGLDELDLTEDSWARWRVERNGFLERSFYWAIGRVVDEGGNLTNPNGLRPLVELDFGDKKVRVPAGELDRFIRHYHLGNLASREEEFPALWEQLRKEYGSRPAVNPRPPVRVSDKIEPDGPTGWVPGQLVTNTLAGGSRQEISAATQADEIITAGVVTGAVVLTAPVWLSTAVRIGIGISIISPNGHDNGQLEQLAAEAATFKIFGMIVRIIRCPRGSTPPRLEIVPEKPIPVAPAAPSTPAAPQRWNLGSWSSWFGRACFAAGTPLLTLEGWKAIEEFRPGDLLLSRHELDPAGEVVPKVVEEVFRRIAKTLVVRVGTHSIRTSAEHPFWVQAKGWLPAGQLIPGDRLLSHDGQWVVVSEVVDTEAWEVVYNLRVADFHTYFVGCDEWGFSVWAHNANACITNGTKGDVIVTLSAPGKEPVNISFPNRGAAEKFIKDGNHTLVGVDADLAASADAAAAAGKARLAHKVSPIPPKNYPNAKLIEADKLEISPEAISQGRATADPTKLEQHGLFDWNAYSPIEVYEKGGKYYIVGGVTRFTNGKASGVTQFPAYVQQAPK